MNNEYIFTPSMNIDLDKIKEIVMRNLDLPVDGLAVHHRRVAGEPYLEELRVQYPFLGTIYNIYRTLPNAVVPIHVCPSRGCGLNIPVSYTDDSYTVFYSVDNDVTKEYNIEKIYDVITSETTEVFRYTLTEPTLMNTMIPHGVFSGPDQDRIIMSWSISVSYPLAKQLLGG